MTFLDGLAVINRSETSPMISGLVDIRDFVKKAPCSLAIHHISCICAPPRRQIQPAQKTLYQRSSRHLDCSLEKTHVGE